LSDFGFKFEKEAKEAKKPEEHKEESKEPEAKKNQSKRGKKRAAENDIS
jgi:hypothetical protein